MNGWQELDRLASLNITRGLLVILPATMIFVTMTSNSHNVTIYFNGGCSNCVQYVQQIEYALHSIGVTDISKRDYYANRAELYALASLREKLNIPQDFAGSVTTIVDGRHIFEGFFPVDIMINFIDSNPDLDALIAAQGFKPNTYRVLKDNMTIECNSRQRLADCISSSIFSNPLAMWTIVLLSGFVNGLNPCAFAVLAYFMGVISVHRSRKEMLKIGIFYVLSIYLVYLGIGTGLTHAILSTGFVQAISRALGIFVLAVAIATLWGAFHRESRLLPKVPKRLILPIARKFSRSWIQKSAIIAALLFGGVVAALEFPCMGGVYTGVVGMLSLRTDLTLVPYLLGYNFMFVLPLIILLILSYRIVNFPSLVEALRAHRLFSRLASAMLMLSLGMLLLMS